MDMNQLFLLGTIPAVLVVFAGMLVRRASGRRYLLFLLAVNAALLLTALIAAWLPPERYPPAQYVLLLVPVALGVLALILLHSKEYLALRRGEKMLALALGLGSVALLAGLGRGDRGMEVICCVLTGAVMLAIVWALGSRFRPMAAVFVGAALALLGSCNAMTTGALTAPQLPPPPIWLSFLLQFLLFVALPGLIPVSAAVLVSTGLKSRSPSGGTGVSSWWPAIWRLSLAVAVLGYLTYTVVWGSIWDQTVDFGWGPFLSLPASVLAVAAGMVMAAVSSGWRRLAGLAFAVIVPLAMSEATTYGSNISHHALTESRAAHLQAAVERYHTRTGNYPAELRQLIPADVWWIPGPVILSGQGWCYQGGKDFYRLGAIYREYWSLPLSIRIYASAGSPPATSWECDQKLTELKPRYDPQPAPGMPNAAPTPAPLPTGTVTMPRILVPPLARASSFSVGDWSPDGAYRVFGVPAVSGKQSVKGWTVSFQGQRVASCGSQAAVQGKHAQVDADER